MGDDPDRLRELVSDVAAAYFANSSVSPADVPRVLAQITASLSAIGASPANAPPPAALAKSMPSAAQIRDSIRPDGLVSFEDGRTYKTLRRHLNRLGITPGQYRQKWGLPSDYPLVAPNLSALRSAMARQKQFGGPAVDAAPTPSGRSHAQARAKAAPAR
jgi:predicted transcriptional regulator